MIVRRMALSVLAFVGAALPVAGAGAEEMSIGIVGRVRTICDVSLAGGATEALHRGDNRLGRMTELCNSVEGYRLVMEHPRGLTNAFVVIGGGRRIPLSEAATSTVIVDSDHPTYVERDLTLVLAETPAGRATSITLYAEPKGVTF